MCFSYEMKQEELNERIVLLVLGRAGGIIMLLDNPIRKRD